MRNGKIKKTSSASRFQETPPKQAMVGNEGVEGRFARRPGHDRLGHGAADLVDLARNHPARARVVRSADHVDVALDDAGVGGVAEDDGEIAVDDLSRLDHHRAEVGPAMVDGLRLGLRRSRAERERRENEREKHGKTHHERGPRAR